eukprot:272932-Pleurochrysis_carterae.AAC.3
MTKLSCGVSTATTLPSCASALVHSAPTCTCVPRTNPACDLPPACDRSCVRSNPRGAQHRRVHRARRVGVRPACVNGWMCWTWRTVSCVECACEALVCARARVCAWPCACA